MIRKTLGLIFCNILIFTNAAIAGAVSGGGGGTTNPHPSTINDVVMAIYDAHAGSIIQSWFNEQQAFFNILGEGQKKSPFYKIFSSNKKISEVLKATKIELRLSKPCYDSDSAPKDASIYGSMPSAICISPFSMASKLNENNVREESLALIVHEITHLFGTTEEEANEIQSRALWKFNKIDFTDATSAMNMFFKGGFGSEMQMLQYNLKLFASNLGNANPTDWEYTKEKLRRIRADLKFGNDKLLFVSPHNYALVTVQFARLYAIENFICINDPRNDDEIKAICTKNIKTTFQDDKEVSARTYMARRIDSNPKDFGAVYDEVVIKRIDSPEDGQAEISKLIEFLDGIRTEVYQTSEIRMYLYRTEP